jgi:hypothetical protein
LVRKDEPRRTRSAFHVAFVAHAIVEGRPCRGGVKHERALLSNVCLKNLAVSYVSLKGFVISRQVSFSRRIKFDKVRASARTADQRYDTKNGNCHPTHYLFSARNMAGSNCGAIGRWSTGKVVSLTLESSHNIVARQFRSVSFCIWAGDAGWLRRGASPATSPSCQACWPRGAER